MKVQEVKKFDEDLTKCEGSIPENEASDNSVLCYESGKYLLSLYNF